MPNTVSICSTLYNARKKLINSKGSLFTRAFCLPFPWKFVLTVWAGLSAAQGLLAATPGYTITASNVSVSGQGSGVSQFTLTSVGGFTGIVGVTCIGPNTNFAPDLILPDCNHPVENFAIPSGGSVSGTMNFYPPWTDSYASASSGRRNQPARSLPLIAGAFAGLGLIGLRMRKIVNRRVALLVGAVCLASLAGIAGCLGQGGLAMTPGTYAYVLQAGSASTTISVTVQCNSCP